MIFEPSFIYLLLRLFDWEKLIKFGLRAGMQIKSLLNLLSTILYTLYEFDLYFIVFSVIFLIIIIYYSNSDCYPILLGETFVDIHMILCQWIAERCTLVFE